MFHTQNRINKLKTRVFPKPDLRIACFHCSHLIQWCPRRLSHLWAFHLNLAHMAGVQGRNYCYRYVNMVNNIVLLEFSPVKLLFIRAGRLLQNGNGRARAFLTTLLAFFAFGLLFLVACVITLCNYLWRKMKINCKQIVLRSLVVLPHATRSPLVRHLSVWTVWVLRQVAKFTLIPVELPSKRPLPRLMAE